MPHQQATTASLMVVASIAGTSALSHWKENHVQVRPAVVLSIAAAIGSALGALSLHYAHRETFFLGFMGLLLVGSWALWTVPASAQSTPLPTSLTQQTVIRWVGLGVAVGFLTGFFGVGGGFLIVPALVVGMGLPMREAVGTSLWVVTTAALSGLVASAHASLPWAQVVPFALAGAPGALLGQKLAKRADTTWLRRLFAVGLVGLAAFLFYKTTRSSS
jgi:uncharacterized membrane protein YfcA